MNMDDASKDVLQNIKQYAEKVRDQRDNAMEIEGQDSSAVEARLASTINELQARLQQRQAELDRVCQDSNRNLTLTDVI